MIEVALNSNEDLIKFFMEMDKAKEVMEKVVPEILKLDTPAFLCEMCTLIDVHAKEYKQDSKEIAKQILVMVSEINETEGPMA